MQLRDTDSWDTQPGRRQAKQRMILCGRHIGGCARGCSPLRRPLSRDCRGDGPTAASISTGMVCARMADVCAPTSSAQYGMQRSDSMLLPSCKHAALWDIR